MPGGNEGPNWILLAGGAAVTALSYLIRRRQKNDFEDGEDELEGKSGKARLVNYNDGFGPDYWDTEACPHQDSVKTVASSSRANSMRSGFSIAPALSRGGSSGLADALLASNGSHDRTEIFSSAVVSEEVDSFQRRVSCSQEDVRRSNQQGVQIGRTAKRDMVHRLRKQLKGRDEMILRMQVQISEYKRSLFVSDAHVADLQVRLEEAIGALSNLDTEVQFFRNQLADFVKFDAKMQDCNECTAGGAESVTSCGVERRDKNLTLLELTKLKEVLDRLKKETTAREIEGQALLQKYNSTVEKVGPLECALKEQMMLVSEKEQVLCATQKELLRVTARLQLQIGDTESLRLFQAKLEACIHNLKSRGFSLRDLHNSEEITSSTSTEVSDSLSHRPQGRGDPAFQDAGDDFNLDFPRSIKDPAVIDSVVAVLQREVEQLTEALASKSRGTEQKDLTIRPAKDIKMNEVSIELAMSKLVEEERADIRRFEAKIADLLRNNSNLAEDSIHEVFNEKSLHVAALICGLAEKLAAQEKQAHQTAMEVQQLSTSIQVLSPIVAKLQDKNTDLSLAGRNIDGVHNPVLGRQDSDASDCSTRSRNQVSPDYLLTEMAVDGCRFRVGTSGPLASKSRKFSSKYDVMNGRRKKPFIHDYGSGSDVDTISPGIWATKSENDKYVHREERFNVEVPRYRQHSLGSSVELLDSESISKSAEVENGHCTSAVQEKDRYAPVLVDVVMAADTPGPEAVKFVPSFDEFSPREREGRSSRQDIENSRRFLFRTGNNRDDHADSLEASTGESVITAESPLEEGVAFEGSFRGERLEPSSISPLSRMTAQVDSTEELRETSSLREASMELLLPDSPQEVAEDEIRSFQEGKSSSADWSIVNRGTDESESITSPMKSLVVSEDAKVSEAKTPVADGLIAARDTTESVSEAGSEAGGSMDSEFDEMLNGTLDDLVKIFSTSVTPSSTPRSSVMSQNSESRNF